MVQARLSTIKQHLTPAQVFAEAIDPMKSMNDERAKAKFNIRELTYLLDGSQKVTELKEQIMLELERDPLFRMDDIHDISKAELRERTMEKVDL
ncbi:fatty-acyl coenzyme A oxidase [Apophysomyces sp. BC1021]|nr:fatty-acyl coenzyme A oxidase [Apophysomyces sp. BC1021]